MDESQVRDDGVIHVLVKERGVVENVEGDAIRSAQRQKGIILRKGRI